jgi:23S rRNA pseudouridine2605 synthase
MAQERLQKIIARAGISSRRAAESLIREGRVRVNGQVTRELGTRADPQQATVEVDGHGVVQAEPPVYIMVHKPPYVVSTAHDPEGRHTILEVVEKSRAAGPRQYEGGLPRVFPVGRLDFDAEGLILLTNDGPLTHAMLHPRRHVPKMYMVKVRGVPNAAALQALRTGVRMRRDDGTLTPLTAPAEVRLVKQTRSNSWLELTLFEGRNHQVKRMCDAVGHSVNRLIRVDFGGVELGDLPTAAWRFLTHPEIKLLKQWQHDGSRP